MGNRAGPKKRDTKSGTGQLGTMEIDIAFFDEVRAASIIPALSVHAVHKAQRWGREVRIVGASLSLITWSYS